VSARLRVLVTVLGLDQHEAGALAVTRLLRDAGAEVIYAGRFQIPQTIATVALEEDVDVVGVSAHSWEVLHYAAELAGRLGAADPPIPVVVGGSVITEADRAEIVRLGIDAAVAPGTGAEDIVATFRALAHGRRALA
jgi:methylmalonyl-CoA mutase C-terminal domain/subunit